MDISSIGSTYNYLNYRLQNQGLSTTNSELNLIDTLNDTDSENDSYVFSTITQTDASELYQQFLSESDWKRMSISEKSEDENMEAIRSQVEDIINTDISSLSDEEISDVLEELQSSLQSVEQLPEAASTLKNADLSSMDSTELKSLLTSIQDEAKEMEAERSKGPKGPGGPPPGPPPSGVVDETEETEETDEESLIEQLLKELEETESIDGEETYYSTSQIIDLIKSYQQA